MKHLALILACWPSAAFAAASTDLLVGTFSNEEQVYFDKEAGRTPPPRRTLRISKTDGGYKVEPVDPFGPLSGPISLLVLGRVNKFLTLNDGRCIRTFKNFKDSLVQLAASGTCSDGVDFSLVDAKGIIIADAGGVPSELRRARTATCWGSTLRDAKKPDGSPDWFFVGGLKLHDQGGRVAFGGGDTGAQPMTLRMRNVIWPQGNSSRPSLVLYIHKPEKPDSAESYVWGDPGAARLGINLRWVQGSCSIDGLDTPVIIRTDQSKG